MDVVGGGYYSHRDGGSVPYLIQLISAVFYVGCALFSPRSEAVDYTIIDVSEYSDWIDASGGVLHSLADDGAVEVDIGFDFPFYGNNQNSMVISANGFLTFGGVGDIGTSQDNTAMPNAALANHIVAPFWDNLNPASGGSIYSLLEGSAPNRRLTIAWVNVPHFSSPRTGSFEVSLYESSGSIVYNYLDVMFDDAQIDAGASATIGVEDSMGNNATLFSHNQANAVANGDALLLTPRINQDHDRDSIPEIVELLTGRNPWVADWVVTTGGYHNCALDDNGVRCWGSNTLGQTTVPELSNPMAVSAGTAHTCALDDRGVVCWGSNLDGQILVPVLVNPVSVNSGSYNTCALDDTGVVCWGSDYDGQTLVPTLNNPTLIEASERHTCALDDSGVVCWGTNNIGQTDVPALSNPVAISTSGGHTCALDAGGVTCWGGGTSDTVIYPEQGQSIVPALNNPVVVSAGYGHSCALDDSGLTCWGSNEEGQTTIPDLSGPVSVSAGGYHTCALDNGGVICWGYTAARLTFVPPLAFDKDMDGLPDSVEDTNGNGIFDFGETDPLDFDSDGDGFNDGEEVTAGSDPLDVDSVPLIIELGDLNTDGNVDATDLLIASRIIEGSIMPTAEQFTAMDIAPVIAGVPSPDMKLTVGDLLQVMRKVLGLDNF
jgi:hypothetical protein